MSNSLESYYVVIFKYYAFDHLSCDNFADISSFDFRKNGSCDITQPFSTPFDVFGILIGHLCVTVCRSLKKLKNEWSTMFRGSAVQNIEEKCFSAKI